MNLTYLGFGLYLLMMIAVGACFMKKTKNIEEYLLGGRSVGSWVTAFSAQASDMSGWLLMGLPGAIYFSGIGEAWVAIGLWIGTLLNWILVAPRLRLYTERTGSLTLSSFFAERFRDPTPMLRILSALVVLLFFVIYAGSGMIATGKLFNSMFGMKYQTAVLIGTGVILLYTLMGGYLAVCWTDLIQGSLMVAALVIVPLVGYVHCGGAALQQAIEAKSGALSLFPNGFGPAAILAILSSAVWGLGYFGQPHILTRFMSIKDVNLLPRTIWIAMIWVTVSLAAAVLIAFLGLPMYPGLSADESEKIFLMMIRDLFTPCIGGILLAAILAAIMSTIDSQLLVASSTLTADFYQRIFRREAKTGELVWISRFFVLLITAAACLLALVPNDTIFKVVKFAWGGFGAAFGPVVLAALYSRKTTWQSALAGMAVGTAVMLIWYAIGWNRYMYEILPGFLANGLTIFILNLFLPQRDPGILAEYDEVKNAAAAKK